MIIIDNAINYTINKYDIKIKDPYNLNLVFIYGL
jgi:hypothetical protein